VDLLSTWGITKLDVRASWSVTRRERAAIATSGARPEEDEAVAIAGANAIGSIRPN